MFYAVNAVKYNPYFWVGEHCRTRARRTNSEAANSKASCVHEGILLNAIYIEW